jgi:hypothetical protein
MGAVLFGGLGGAGIEGLSALELLVVGIVFDVLLFPVVHFVLIYEFGSGVLGAPKVARSLTLRHSLNWNAGHLLFAPFDTTCHFRSHVSPAGITTLCSAIMV